ncbi:MULTISPECIES: hypothetical protein [Klebsiella pneumoniae complex]|uniref:hypothetical protein n=1 Tax=Klebsiella pneumoniae complex TaxID=3390273 RepID=UPI001FCB3EE6|nr:MULTISPECIES: hypothetical protein [Klebsiella]HDU5778350.1 hypothetical protein [Klebsiella variicola]MCJ4908252.1 hypothetical protein [Klebsiella quasipneumoniae]MCR6121473.1 hypothetical protein [Klebsiella pneumoniae]MCR6134784.1 hypothetical protein [Klebsiella pneumoniae]HBT2892750.1 hypothetical protein [Klebsiella pneumoniae]
MTERGMIFNAEMVRAILAGRKTQTRRPIKWKQTRFTEIGEREDGSKWPWSEDAEHACDFWHPCPFGAVGDRIWVRETWSSDFANYYPNDRVWYAADNNRQLDIDMVDGIRGIYSPESDVHVPFRWHPSIHMPRWASRILLEITGVRVERLQSITLGDICKEVGCGLYDFRPATYGFQVWEELWKSIYGAESWNANPWVWVIEFKRVEAEKSEGGAA